MKDCKHLIIAVSKDGVYTCLKCEKKAFDVIKPTQIKN